MNSNYRLRLLELRGLEEIQQELVRIGADEEGIRIMAPKGQGLLVRVQGLSIPAANVLKQEMLSLGGDCATHREVITGRVSVSNAILIGDLRSLKRLAEKIAHQSFGLSRLAEELSELLNRVEKPPKFSLDCRGICLNLSERTHIMGILNLTPDSFYDGGKYTQPEKAIERGIELEAQGANIIDLGGESSRPGSEPIPIDLELKRIMPVLEGLLKEVKVPLSVDTYKSQVAEVALRAGAHFINDISALRFDPRMVDVVGKFGVPLILMHIKGKPKDMQANPTYEDLMTEIYEYLEDRIEFAAGKGLNRDKIIIDPGIGFGKRIMDNYEILRRLGELKSLGCPILIGPSRKSFIGAALELPADQRLEGTAAAVAIGMLNGANIVRVHDVKEMARVVQISDLIVGKTKLD